MKPTKCNSGRKVKIPIDGNECEFWLITVTDESGITNPNKDHAYLTDSGKLYIYNGKTLIQVNCDICFTQEERDKLEGIEEGANKYVLPVASSTELGGVLLGYTQDGRNYPVLKDEGGRIYVQVPWVEYSLPIAKDDTLGGIKTGYQTQGKVYALQVDSSGNGYVSVPWTDNDTTYNVVSTSANGLAPKLPDDASQYLNGQGQWTTPSGYSLPQASSNTLGGVKIGSNITVSNGTISLNKDNVVSALGYTPPTTNTTYEVATTSDDGLMSATDKSRLDQLWAKFDSMVFFTND